MTPSEVGPYIMAGAAIATAIAPYLAARRGRRSAKSISTQALMAKINETLYAQWKDGLKEIDKLRQDLSALRKKHEEEIAALTKQHDDNIYRIAELERNLSTMNTRTSALEGDVA